MTDFKKPRKTEEKIKLYCDCCEQKRVFNHIIGKESRCMTCGTRKRKFFTAGPLIKRNNLSVNRLFEL